jgi:DNA-binding NarL/FixJ family response regulator
MLNIDDDQTMSSVRVLIAEDFEPFRRFLCSVLRNETGSPIICEVSDGLEAVQEAEKLKPDLILLDIGLPTLNGIEAARQILRLAPESKIILVSMESSIDVVEEAFRLGAWGYVVKTTAAIDLVAAVDAVLAEQRFASGTLDELHLNPSNDSMVVPRLPS